MAFSQFPAPAAAGADSAAFAATITDLQTTYEIDQVFEVGAYSISVSPVTTQAQLVFADATSILSSLETILGVVVTSLSTPATKVFITTKTGGTANAIVTIEKKAVIITIDDIGNGTLDTINTTGAYNETGLLSVLAFGGGAAGEKGGVGTVGGGFGGSAGGVAMGFVYNNGATTITIGAKGVAAVSNNTNITAPTASSFGNLLTSSTNSFFFAGAGGAPGTGGNVGAVGAASSTFTSFNTNSTTGGGGGGPSGIGGNAAVGSSVGGGSGIGTGGTSAIGVGGQSNTTAPSVAGTAGTGKASGGGAGSSVGGNNVGAAGRFGGDGTDGVVFVLRGF